MRFVIIASRRTGSTHFVTTLGGHPEIFCNGNIFKASNMQLFWPKEVLGGRIRSELLDLRKNAPMRFLERVYSENFGRRHVGFKIFQGQQDEILSALATDSEVGKIVLFRENGLASYSSAQIANRTGKFAAANAVTEQVKVWFDAHKFVSYHSKQIEYYREIISMLNRKRQKYHVVCYHQISNPAMLAGVVNFIGADPNVTMSTDLQYRITVKQNSNDIVSRFQNTDDVLRFLGRHSLMHWAYEGATSFEPIVDRPGPEA